MSPDTSPFRDPAHRIARPLDDVFFRALSARQAVVRLIGPRRIGKTELVSHFARQTGTPLVNVTIPTVPADIQPADVVLPLLQQAIAELVHSAPALHAEFKRVQAAEKGHPSKQTFGGELEAGVPGFFTAKLSSSKEQELGSPQLAPHALAQIGPVLRQLEQAASRTKIRPVILFDEVQELVPSAKAAADMGAAWAIRNEIQHHSSCRYVLAGSNQRLLAQLATGRTAPFLNLGTAIEIPLLTGLEVDAWAKPLFEAGGRHVRSLANTSGIVAGKIGEVVDVFDNLWLMTKPGEVLDEKIQRDAILATATSLTDPIGLRTLTRPQTAVLRWVLEHPGKPPYGTAAEKILELNPGTISTSLRALLDQGLIETFGSKYVATFPLRTLRALQPMRLAQQLEPGQRPATKWQLRRPSPGNWPSF